MEAPLSRRVRLRGLLAGALSGALAALAFPSASQVWLAWLSLVPLLAHLRATRGGHVGTPFLFFGVLYFSVGLSWLNPVITVVGTALLALLLTLLFTWPFGHAIGYLIRRGYPFLVCVPVAWVGFDWIRTWLYSGFPWLYLAHTQADLLPLIQVSDVAGAHAVTGLIVLVNAAVTESAFQFVAGRRKAALAPIGIAAAFLAAALVYGAIRPGTIEERDGPRVLLVQANVPQFMKKEALHRADHVLHSREDILRTHLVMTRRAIEKHPDVDVVIWPETMFTLRLTDEPDPLAQEDMRRARQGLRMASVAAGGRPVILGAPYTTEAGEPRNSVFLLDARGTPTARYDKLHRVPGGEYLPFRDQAPEALVRWVERIVEANAGFVPDLTAGDEVVVFEAADIRFAPLVCFEIMFPAICNETLDHDVDVLLNLTNYGWFPETSEPEQAHQMAVFRAVENRRPVVVSANTGVSEIISATGTSRQLTVKGRTFDVGGVLEGAVPLTDSSSLYGSWGDLPAGVAAALALLGVVAGLLGRFVRRRS